MDTNKLQNLNWDLNVLSKLKNEFYISPWVWRAYRFEYIRINAHTLDSYETFKTQYPFNLDEMHYHIQYPVVPWDIDQSARLFRDISNLDRHQTFHDPTPDAEHKPLFSYHALCSLESMLDRVRDRGRIVIHNSEMSLWSWASGWMGAKNTLAITKRPYTVGESYHETIKIMADNFCQDFFAACSAKPEEKRVRVYFIPDSTYEGYRLASELWQHRHEFAAHNCKLIILDTYRFYLHLLDHNFFSIWLSDKAITSAHCLSYHHIWATYCERQKLQIQDWGAEYTYIDQNYSTVPRSTLETPYDSAFEILLEDMFNYKMPRRVLLAHQNNEVYPSLPHRFSNPVLSVDDEPSEAELEVLKKLAEEEGQEREPVTLLLPNKLKNIKARQYDVWRMKVFSRATLVCMKLTAKDPDNPLIDSDPIAANRLIEQNKFYAEPNTGTDDFQANQQIYENLYKIVTLNEMAEWFGCPIWEDYRDEIRSERAYEIEYVRTKNAKAAKEEELERLAEIEALEAPDDIYYEPEPADLGGLDMSSQEQKPQPQQSTQPQQQQPPQQGYPPQQPQQQMPPQQMPTQQMPPQQQPQQQMPPQQMPPQQPQQQMPPQQMPPQQMPPPPPPSTGPGPSYPDSGAVSAANYASVAQLQVEVVHEQEAEQQTEGTQNEQPEMAVKSTNDESVVDEVMSQEESVADVTDANAESSTGVVTVSTLQNKDMVASVEAELLDEGDTYEKLRIPLDKIGLNPDMAFRGGFVDEYIQYAMSRSPRTPRLFHESAALMVISILVARRMMVPLSVGPVFPNLYILWNASSTLYAKTSGMGIAEDLIRTYAPYLLHPHTITPEKMLENMKDQERNRDKNNGQFDSEVNRLEYVFAAQKSFIMDEASQFLASARKDYNAGLVELVLRGYDCSTYRTATVSRGESTISNIYMAFWGASTPAAMQAYMTDPVLSGGGFWQRFTILTPDEQPIYAPPGAGNNVQPPLGVYGFIEYLLYRLPIPHTVNSNFATSVHLSNEAYVLYNAYDQILFEKLKEDHLNDDPVLENHRAVYGRLAIQAMKVAQLLALTTWSQDLQAPYITYSHMVRAILIVESWRESLHRATRRMARHKDRLIEERIMRTIIRTGSQGASLAEIKKSLRSTSRRDIMDCIDGLLRNGDIQVRHRVMGPKGGRPTDRYVAIHESNENVPKGQEEKKKKGQSRSSKTNGSQPGQNPNGSGNGTNGSSNPNNQG